MDGFDASTYGEGFADVYDEWYGEVSDAAATVEVVADHASGGPVLELGVGTGRLALPLVERGLEVHGIDASPAMLRRLASKPGGERVRITLGDFADLDLEGPPAGGFAVALVAFNTIFNLADADAQRRCLGNVAAALRRGGSLLVEAFVPDPDHVVAGGAVTPTAVEADRVVLQVTKQDPASQTVTGSVVTITEGGVRLRPWRIRYADPAELDEMAAGAGLVLAERWGGWDRSPFDEDSPRHVSRYERRSR